MVQVRLSPIYYVECTTATGKYDIKNKNSREKYIQIFCKFPLNNKGKTLLPNN